MTYHAKPDKKQIKKRMILYGVLALVCIALYYALSVYRWAFQIGWLIFVGMLLFLLIRYGISEYRYELRKDGLYIIRINGKNEVVLNVIPAKNISGIFSPAAIDLKLARYLNYCASYKPPQVIFIGIEGMVHHQKYVRIEADDEFKKKIKQWRSETVQEEKTD